MTVPDREMRASDNDRRLAADRLRIAAAEGRITVFEYDNRLGRLYRATTHGEIADLLADLPGPAPVPPPMPMPMPMPQAVIVGPVRNSGLATAGLVLGICGLVGFWIPFLDIILSVLAVLLSAIGLSQTREGQMGGRGLAIAGLVCGLVGLVPAIVIVVIVVPMAIPTGAVI